MPRTPTDRAPQRTAREQPLAHKISALRPLSSDARAQQVTDVVDAFRRLRGSVVRFIRMFSAAHAENAQDDALSAMGFRELLSTLEDDARTARFTRLPELERAIGHARRLAQQHLRAAQRLQVMEQAEAVDDQQQRTGYAQDGLVQRQALMWRCFAGEIDPLRSLVLPCGDVRG